MAENIKRQIEKFDADYQKIASKDVWEPCDITLMKDLQKLMYYLEVREAMKEGGDYPGSGYIDNDDDMNYRSYARGRDRMGRYTSGRSMRSYDSEKEDAIHKLHKVMDSENNQEFKMAIQEAIHMLEAK